MSEALNPTEAPAAQPLPASASELEVGGRYGVPVGTRIEGQFVYVDNSLTGSIGSEEIEIVLLRSEMNVQSQVARVNANDGKSVKLDLLPEFAVSTVPVDVGHLRMSKNAALGLASSIFGHILRGGTSKSEIFARLISQPGFSGDDFTAQTDG